MFLIFEMHINFPTSKHNSRKTTEKQRLSYLTDKKRRVWIKFEDVRLKCMTPILLSFPVTLKKRELNEMNRKKLLNRNN